jgi:hypothetical protein
MGLKIAPQQRNSKLTSPSIAKTASTSLRSRAPAYRLQNAIGNSATTRLLRTGNIQPKLTVSNPGDASEREADRIANEVTSMPKPQRALSVQRSPLNIQRQCPTCKEEPKGQSIHDDEEKMVQAKAVKTSAAPEGGGELGSYLNTTRGAGQALLPSTRAYFESRFGLDLEAVRVHTDDRAARASRDISAQAFTSGSDIYFGSGRYQPGTPSGDGLLAHEIVHSIQQAGTQVRHVARQPSLGIGAPEIPTDLKSSPAVRLMTKEALQNRYDRVTAALARFNMSTPEAALLEQQITSISNELARRLALEQKRTFDQRVIDQMKAYLVENAKTERDSCIVCMNKGIRKLLEDPNQKLTPESVDATMELLRQSGRASEAREIGFNDVRGRLTRAAGKPHSLRESVSGAVLEMVGGDVGWSVFGMSLMDGLHSVMLTVDTHDPSNPRIYWSDQWKSKGGWKEYTRDGLDREITKLIQGWWDKQPEGGKHNLVVRVWRLRQ